MCSGYYRYDEGYTPEFPGIERFAGEVDPPPALARGPRLRRQAGRRDRQRRDRDDAGPGDGRERREGDDAAALADLRDLDAGRRPRSPTGCAASFRSRVAYADRALEERHPAGHLLPAQPRAPGADEEAAAARRRSRRCPPATTSTPTSSPSYNPWDQRLCLVPDADLFRRSRDGSAEIVTDRIETFTEGGIELESGAELEADVVVTATGLNLLFLGGMKIAIDGERARPAANPAPTRG